MKLEDLTSDQFYIPQRYSMLLGFKAIELIKKRTEKGKDVDNQDFKPYSQKWFGRPAAGLQKNQLEALQGLQEETEISYTRRDNSILFILIKGYDLYKKTVYSREYGDGTPNLRATGEMMDGMTVIDSDNNSFMIGWVRPELSERAFYVNELREFFSLNDDEIDELMLYAENFIVLR